MIELCNKSIASMCNTWDLDDFDFDSAGNANNANNSMVAK